MVTPETMQEFLLSPEGGLFLLGLGFTISFLTTIAALLYNYFAFVSALLALALVALVAFSHSQTTITKLLALLIIMELAFALTRFTAGFLQRRFRSQQRATRSS